MPPSIGELAMDRRARRCGASCVPVGRHPAFYPFGTPTKKLSAEERLVLAWEFGESYVRMPFHIYDRLFRRQRTEAAV